MDDKGFITCNVTNGAELKISEEVFEFRLRDMKGWNEMIKENIRDGRGTGLFVLMMSDI